MSEFWWGVVSVPIALLVVAVVLGCMWLVLVAAFALYRRIAPMGVVVDTHRRAVVLAALAYVPKLHALVLPGYVVIVCRDFGKTELGEMEDAMRQVLHEFSTGKVEGGNR